MSRDASASRGPRRTVVVPPRVCSLSRKLGFSLAGILVVGLSFWLPIVGFLAAFGHASLLLPLLLGGVMGLTFAIFGSVITYGLYTEFEGLETVETEPSLGGTSGEAGGAVAVVTSM